MKRHLWRGILALCLFCGARAHSELVTVVPRDLEGGENWKERSSWGAGFYCETDGTPLNGTVTLAGGEYQVYARMATSPTTDAHLVIRLGEGTLRPPMQAKVSKLAWLRLGAVVLPAGETKLVVELPPGVAPGGQNLAALVFCSSPLDDRPGRAADYADWLRHELLRLEAPRPAPCSAGEARERQESLRADLLRALGLDRMPPRTPLNPVVTGSLDRGAYVIEKVAFESRPRHVVPALLYLPKERKGPVPAVVSAIGHWSYGKSSRAPQSRAVALVRAGFAVLALDPVYAWERAIPGNSEGFEPLVAGGCIAGHEVWDIMRAVDYLETRPEIDAARLGVSGASGGGLQAFYAGAVDTRFSAVMPAVALWPMAELAVNAYYSADNWVPNVSRMGGMGSLIALTAPRAVLVMNMDADFATSPACEIMVNAARPYYAALGAEARLLHTIGKGPHDYTREMRENTVAFAGRWLGKGGDGLPPPEEDLEGELFAENDPALFVFDGGKIPAEGAETVQTIWTAEAEALRAALPKRPRKLAERVRDELLRIPPLGTPSAVETDRGLLVTTDPGVTVAALRVGSGNAAVVWVGEKGFNEEAERPEVRALAEHATVYVLEPRGAASPDDLHILRHASLVMGRPLAGQWVHDTLCLVDWLARSKRHASVSVAGHGPDMGPVCLLAALLDRRVASAGIHGMFSSFVQLVGHGSLVPQIPGVLRMADVPQMVAAAGPDRIRLNRPMKYAPGPTLPASDQSVTEFFSEWARQAAR